MRNFFSKHIGLVIIISIIGLTGIFNMISFASANSYDRNDNSYILIVTKHNDIIKDMGGDNIINSGNGYDTLICSSGYDIIFDFDPENHLILECENQVK